MASSLNKVTKKVAKKKGGLSTLHEKSRDAKRIRRASSRQDKLARTSALRMSANQVYLDRVDFFRSTALQSTGTFTSDECTKLVEAYISRDDEELESLRAARRPGRPSSRREDQLRQQHEAETSEYRSGYWMPDLTAEEAVEQLRDWNKSWEALAQIKFIRLTQEGRIIPSGFPPNGRS